MVETLVAELNKANSKISILQNENEALNRKCRAYESFSALDAKRIERLVLKNAELEDKLDKLSLKDDKIKTILVLEKRIEGYENMIQKMLKENDDEDATD